jgi:hypothetical protein
MLDHQSGPENQPAVTHIGNKINSFEGSVGIGSRFIPVVDQL